MMKNKRNVSFWISALLKKKKEMQNDETKVIE